MYCSVSVNKSVFTLNPTDELVIGCWSMRGFSSGQFYQHAILNQFDIFSVSEHWLFEEQLCKLECVDSRYVGYGKASQDNPNILSGQSGQGRGLECFGKLAWVILYPSCQSIVTGSFGLSLYQRIKNPYLFWLCIFQHPITPLRSSAKRWIFCGLYTNIIVTRVLQLLSGILTEPWVILVVIEFALSPISEENLLMNFSIFSTCLLYIWTNLVQAHWKLFMLTVELPLLL